ncbi:hypothetical protein EVAR_27453_1 [Eumeta japonica]|uniref:Uncharacterized protein n=1 Tax=Eumeta variegata TaxID=151549 RepID=A0A4C1VKH1_EUMVA|nr:hypothetical protein EVAR_27453_1 [Eumeta japonica]
MDKERHRDKHIQLKRRLYQHSLSGHRYREEPIRSQSTARHRAPVTRARAPAMDKGAVGRPVGRADVLKKLNAENLLVIERGLLGDLPEKLRPPPLVQPRARPQDLVLTKPPSSTLLSSCLPIVPDSPGSDPGKLKVGEDEVSPLKKTFSFRDKFTRMNFFGREKSPKSKWKLGMEQEMKGAAMVEPPGTKCEQEKKRRLWFFKNRDGDKIKSPSTEKKYFASDKKPIYKRSKSFEFLPRAAEDEDCIPSAADKIKHRSYTKNRLSYMFGSNESISEAWLSSESFEELQKYKILNMSKGESFKYLENAKERGPGSTASSKSHTSSASTALTSNNSGLLDNLLQSESVQNLFFEFDKAVEMFSENYASDCEPYTKDAKVKFDMPVREKRKSRSFSTMPSPKIVHVKCTTVSELSETFSRELNKMLSEMRKDKGVSSGGETPRSARRGSVTDWCVLEEPPVQTHAQSHPQDKYRRAQKKPTNRIRRISSTKYADFLYRTDIIMSHSDRISEAAQASESRSIGEADRLDKVGQLTHRLTFDFVRLRWSNRFHSEADVHTNVDVQPPFQRGEYFVPVTLSCASVEAYYGRNDIITAILVLQIVFGNESSTTLVLSELAIIKDHHHLCEDNVLGRQLNMFFEARSV